MKLDTKLFVLLKMKWRTYFPASSGQDGWEEKIKALFYGGFLFLFMLGAYWFFYRSFDYLSEQPQIGAALMNRILSIGFLTFFSMLFASNIITALSTLYRSPEVTYLMTTPAPVIDIFTLKSIENIFFSSWAILILGSPIVFAYGVAMDAPKLYYPLVITTMLIFIVVPASFGISATVLFSRFFARLRLRHVMILAVSIFTLVMVIFLTYVRPNVIVLEETEDLSQVNRFLDTLPASTSFLSPSSWLTRIFNEAINLNLAEAGFYFLVLLSTAMMTFQVTYWLGERFYYRSWTDSLVAKELQAMEVARRQQIRHSWLWGAFPKIYRTLLEKDSMIFWRDPTQWSQLLILVILLIFYIVNLRNLPSQITHLFWKTMISFFNFGFTGYVLATVSVRFVYPAISLEGRNFWVIGTAPIRLSTIFWGKFWQTFVVFFFCAQALVTISNYMLRVEPIVYYVGFFGTTMMSMTLTAISLGMGAVFPYFKERNPSRIASSAGGLVTVLISLIYVAVVVIILAQPLHFYFRSLFYHSEFSHKYTLAAGAVVLAISAIVTFISIYFGRRALQSRDL